MHIRSSLVRRALAFIAASAAALGLTSTSSAAGAAPVARVAEGALKGDASAGVDRFLGVPYAAPPTGELRWMAPAPPPKWQGTRDASKLRSKCPQNHWTDNSIKYRDESCLFVNVYRPRAGAPKKPVIVWLHGGAYTRGSSQDVDGSVLAQKADAVVVTVNYRLGVFGFLSLPQLAKEAGGHSGDYGLMDQQAALRWVKTNIAAFGGDPAAVTLMGQSAGAGSTWIHLVSPGSRGLISKAVMMSGSAGPNMRTAAQEQSTGASSRLPAKLGCDRATDVLACLRSMTTDSVIEAGGLTPAAGWGPVIDGYVLPGPVPKLVKAGAGGNIPILSGVMSQDSGFNLQRNRAAGIAPWAPADYAAAVGKMSGGDSILKQYPVASYSTPDDAFIALSSDAGACNTVLMNKVASEHHAVFGYEFDDRSAPSTIFHVPDHERGAYHTFELPYFFQTGYPNDLDPAIKLSPQQLALSERIIADLRAFAWTGKPGDANRWSKNTTLRWKLEGDIAVPAARYAEEHKCAFWRGLGRDS